MDVTGKSRMGVRWRVSDVGSGCDGELEVVESVRITLCSRHSFLVDSLNLDNVHRFILLGLLTSYS